MPKAFAVLGALLFALSSLPVARAEAGEALRLAPGLSFTDDSSTRFPIEGNSLGDAAVGKGRVTLAFFGAAHCWNTNREAERVVAVYPKYRDRVRFVIIDVNHPSAPQRRLLERHYKGYIPTLVVFASDGGVYFEGSGESAREQGDTTRLESLLDRALDATD